MRGDSLRDLYAKLLAIAGLAMLGALGAVVDYWPAARQPSPQMATRNAAPATPSAARAAEPPHVVAVVDQAAPVVPTRVARPRPAVSEPRVEPAVFTSTPAANAIQTDGPVSAPVLPVVLPSIEPQPVTTLNAPPVELAPPPQTNSVSSQVVPEMLNLIQVSVAQPPNDGFLSIAAKKTTTSIAKTGSTIAGAFRSVGGAVSDAVNVALRRFFE